MTQTIEIIDEPPQRFRDREREIELEAAVRRLWEFARTTPLDALTEDQQDECWALNKLGRDLLNRRPKR